MNKVQRSLRKTLTGQRYSYIKSKDDRKEIDGAVKNN